MLAPLSNTFIVYGAGVGEIPLHGIHYYKSVTLDGNVVTGVCCIVCDREMIYTYENTADSFLHMTMTNSQHHYFGKCLWWSIATMKKSKVILNR